MTYLVIDTQGKSIETMGEHELLKFIYEISEKELEEARYQIIPEQDFFEDMDTHKYLSERLMNPKKVSILEDVLWKIHPQS